MSIVVASDLTFRSDRAVARGRLIAAASGAPLHVVHVVDEKQPASLVDHAVAWAREALAHECSAHAPGAATHVFVGDPRRRIAAEAETLGATLIVVGLHDPSKDGPFSFRETTAGRLVAHARRPVLLVRGEAGGPYARAVVGVDFSMHARIAVEETHRLFPTTPLTLAHAYPVAFRDRLGGADYLADVAAEERRLFDAFLEQEMAWLVERATRSGVPEARIETVIQEGRASDVLRDVVAKTGADLLAVGTHGANMIERLIWGSVASALLDDPPCDVLVVDAKRRAR
jgi:nucleotide-binding universal stress UspA family protein